MVLKYHHYGGDDDDASNAKKDGLNKKRSKEVRPVLC